MSKFKYQGRSEDTVNRRIADRGGDYDTYLKVDPMKVAEGENIFRILPPTWDVKGPWGDNWAIDVYLHWDVGADKGTYLCARKMHDIDPKLCPEDRCPVCEMLEDLDDDEIKKRLKAKRSLLAYVIDRKDEKAGPQIWRLGKQLEGNLQFRSKDKKTGAVLPIDHPERGYDISFNRVGNDEKTKYTNEDVDRDSSYISEDQKKEDKWLDYITDKPLPEQLNFYPYEHIAKVVKGRSSKKTSDDDAPSRGRRRGGDDEETDRGSSRSRSRDSDDDESSSRRRRSSEPEEEADRSSRRSRASEEDEGSSRQRRRSEPEEESDRGSRRRSRDDDEPDEKEGRPRAGKVEDDEDDNSSRRRPSRDEDEKEERSSSRRERSSRDSEEKEEPKGRERAHRAKSEDEDEIPSEGRRRAPAKDDDEGEEEPEDEPKGKTTDRAKASLERLKPKDKK